MNKTSLGLGASGACARAGMPTTKKRTDSAKVLKRKFINVVRRVDCLLALRRCASGKTERGGDRYPPAVRCLDENPLRDSARSGVLLSHRVTVGSVDHTGSYGQNAQVSRDQRVRPGRVT